MNTFRNTTLALILTAGMSIPALAQSEITPPPQGAPPLGQQTINSPTYWGWGLGFVFTEVPISESEFRVLMSQLHYGFYLTDPDDFVRTAATLGLYGFALVLPVPKVGVEMIIGDPRQDVQGKVGINGFYDISVGGHGGIALELGVRMKNRVDISFFTVPFGSDSKRDYLEFMGFRDEAGESPHVIMPYYGIFISFNY